MFYMVLCFTPTTVIGAISGTAQAALTYATLLIPVNQLVAGVRCVLWIEEAATFAAAHDPTAAAPTVRDFFVLTFAMPGDAGAAAHLYAGAAARGDGLGRRMGRVSAARGEWCRHTECSASQRPTTAKSSGLGAPCVAGNHLKPKALAFLPVQGMLLIFACA